MELQATLPSEFHMKYLGFPTKFLSIQIERMTSGMLIHQSDLITKIISRFEVLPDQSIVITPMDQKIKFNKTMSCSPLFQGPYRHAIGCLQYLVACSRPDIASAVSILSSFSPYASPTVVHWEALMRVLHYLKGTAQLGLSFFGPHGRGACISWLFRLHLGI